MPWMICSDSTMTTKTQFINANNFNKLLTYMAEKHPDFTLNEDRAELREQIFFEYGGSGSLVGAQPKMNFLLPTSTLRLDCIDVPKWIEELKTSVKRKFSDDTEYYKIYSRLACLILTPEERDTLLFQLSRQKDRANKESKEFFERLHAVYERLEYSYDHPMPKDIPIITLPPEDDPEK